MLSALHGGLKPFSAPRPLRTSRLLARFSTSFGYDSHSDPRATCCTAAKGLAGSHGEGDDNSASSAHFSSSTSGTAGEGIYWSPFGIRSSEDLIRFLKRKIRSHDEEVVKEVYRFYVKQNNGGLEALEKISAIDWLLQWGNGYIEAFDPHVKFLSFWAAWRIYAAYNTKAKGDVAPLPASFLALLPKEIFENETKVAQSRKKQQALLTTHMASLLSFPGARFPAQLDEKAVMRKLQSVLSRDPWALMMKHSTFSFKEMEAVAEEFGADMNSPSRGAAALLSSLTAECNTYKVSYMDWPRLEDATAALLGPDFPTPLRQCMAGLLNGKIKLEFFEPGSSWRAFEPAEADASQSSWNAARCLLCHI
ncbi:hypothetical protein DUNSADRAFT_9709 [Dunaliella salina]|uniref:ATP-dependent RecD2 DNA helicase-like helix-hairpin-helix domain-containing protein n=1 Tax=Dunaliella salina TaxID=3046 RepID=A0ABQ7GGV5_DUNSA|nr:hypothetical protein DUNSADRAFT_9709 [Dunaliella salina]|eukprot:KAF5833835.1 hypothetical protein DUNSADRAFT_9709 [Dunaliella salina]